jgi:hypothetical protein
MDRHNQTALLFPCGSCIAFIQVVLSISDPFAGCDSDWGPDGSSDSDGEYWEHGVVLVAPTIVVFMSKHLPQLRDLFSDSYPPFGLEAHPKYHATILSRSTRVMNGSIQSSSSSVTAASPRS